MAVLFDGELDVHYGFISCVPSIRARAESSGVMVKRTGANGLCGAAEPGVLSLTTGLHTGSVPIVVEALDAEPEVGSDWEEVVEVSFTTERTDLVLAAFEDSEPVTLPAPGTYRVRFSASGMDEAHQTDVRMPEEPEIDRYLLQLWPAPARPDEIVLETSSSAAYWHGVARQASRPRGADARANAPPGELVKGARRRSAPPAAPAPPARCSGRRPRRSAARACGEPRPRRRSE